jgi:aspartate 1-decarboxylase
MMALPSASNATEKKEVDTLIALQTSIIRPPDSAQCYIKFFNANPDASATYSIKSGCPNGENVFIDNAITAVQYKQSTGVQAVYEGKRVYSIIKNISGESASTKLIGIFEFDLVRQGQYAMVVNKRDELYFIDELSTEPVTLVPQQPIAARSAYVRVVNLSSEPITVAKSSGGELTTNLNPFFIDKYETIATCDQMSLDKLSLIHNGITTDSTFFSFDVYKKYTILAFDTKDKAASKIIPVQPINDRFPISADKAVIRVVNGNYDASGITVSIGARTANNDYGYESGTTLAVNLLDGEVSKDNSVSGGYLPISVFSATEPTKFLFSSNIHIENGKEYLLAVDFSNDEGRMSVIEASTEQANINFEQHSIFIQIVNVANGEPYITFSLPTIIANGKIIQNTSVATFIPEGSNTITLNGKTHSFTTTKNKRSLIVATANANNADIFDIQSASMDANATTLKWRFINASDDTPTLQVISDYGTGHNIKYMQPSPTFEQYKDRKYTFTFKNQDTDTELLVIGDLLMTLNKNYTILFYGNKSVGYKVTILQEY